MKNKILITAVSLIMILAVVFAIGCGKNAESDKSDGSRISFAEKTIELKEGQTVKITPTIDAGAGGLIFWSVKDREVASVDDDGNITALSAGSTICYAQLGKDIAKCNVVVTEYEAPAALSLKTDKDSFTLQKGDEFILPITVMFGKDEVTEYMLESVVADGQVVSENGGAVTALNAGETKILLKVSYSNQGRTYFAEHLISINVY